MEKNPDWLWSLSQQNWLKKIMRKRGKCWVCLLKSETVATLKVFSHRRKEKKNNWQLKNKSHSENIGEHIV